MGGKGYGPGMQAWYNQFLAVDPANADHVYAGLEEVYETKNAGSHWSTVGPYWNFYFPAGATSTRTRSRPCPLTTHSDQHVDRVRHGQRQASFFVGNDGGVYRRPVNGKVNAERQRHRLAES